MTRFVAHAVIALRLAWTAVAGAQSTTSVVRVRVVDTAGVAVAEALVAATRGVNTVVASGTVNSAGSVLLTVPRGPDDLQMSARRIGYDRSDRFFRADRDSIDIVITMHGAVQSLPTVAVTAQQDLKRKRFHVTAEDIAASTRPIDSGLDVVTKLRPDMMNPPGQGIVTRCGLYYLWVNGVRVVYPPVDPALADRARIQRRAARSAQMEHLGVTGQASIPVGIQSALASIRPEHIEAMTYADCSDTTVVRASARGALFVALKPGVAYDPNRGSYVADGEAITAEDLAESTLPPYRIRILGVYDDATGAPIAGAEIVDAATGTYATTTATGTVSLAYLPDGVSVVRIRKSGYAELKLDVTISANDTTPITVVLKQP